MILTHERFAFICLMALPVRRGMLVFGEGFSPGHVMSFRMRRRLMRLRRLLVGR